MKTFITDSIAIKKKYPDFLFTNSIYNWTIKEAEDGYFNLNKKIIFKEKIPFNKIVGIVSPSNYRLIFDLLTIDKNATFYKPENFTFGRRKKLNIDKSIINKQFEEYIKRSYISYLNYENLKRVGLKRIEQYILLLITASLKNTKIYDNLMIKEDFTVNKVIEGKESGTEIKKIQLLKFIYILNKELKFSFDDILSYILRMYAELKITDPFDERGFIFIEHDDSEIYNIYKKIINKKILWKEKIILNNKKKLLIKETKENSLASDYLLLQKEKYFEGMFIFSEKNFPNIVLIDTLVKGIIPKKDTILTLKLLLLMKKIKETKMHIYIEDDYAKKLNLKKNKDWINRSIWKEIYNNQDYMFGGIIDPITCESINFKCPVCGEENFKVTPQKIFCGKNSCQFKFNRINLKSFGIPKISVEQSIEALNNESLLLKTNKGNNLPVFLKNDKDYYYLYIE